MFAPSKMAAIWSDEKLILEKPGTEFAIEKNKSKEVRQNVQRCERLKEGGESEWQAKFTQFSAAEKQAAATGKGAAVVVNRFERRMEMLEFTKGEMNNCVARITSWAENRG